MPIPEHLENYEEHDLFDVAEFLFDHVSNPVDGYFHAFAGCGMHYSTFNRQEGQLEFKDALNQPLEIYKEGYVISDGGGKLNLPEKGLSLLTEAGLPKYDPDNIEARVDAAVSIP